MNGMRFLLYFVGGALVVGGLVLLFFESGLAAWIPAGIALAGLVVIIGLLLVGLSNRADDLPARHVEHHHDAPEETPTQQVYTERYVERERTPTSRRRHVETRTRTVRRHDDHH